MSGSSSPLLVRRRHTVLGGGPRYETAELILPTIANFELKQKGRILELFTEIYNVCIQEIQDALDERQNHVSSLLERNEVDVEPAETFAFESQPVTHEESVALDLSSQHVDSSSSVVENNNEPIENTLPLSTPAENQEETSTTICSDNRQRRSSWTSAKDPSNIKNEPTGSPKTKRRRSNKKPSSSSISKGSNSRQQALSTVPSMHQMTMTQLFNPPEPTLPPSPCLQPIVPNSKVNEKETHPIVSTVKQEPESPTIDAMMFMPESLIGLAQPFEETQEEIPLVRHNDIDIEPQNNESNVTSRIDDEVSSESPRLNTNRHSLKRKMSISPSREIDPIQQTPLRSDNIHEDENEHNRAVLESPYADVETEELLYACSMCRNYWLGLPEELRHKEGLSCRHRQRPVVRTPEHFWSLGIPSTQTCIQRGYGGVLPPEKPVERLRRPRRQHQRLLQEQQQKDDSEDEEEVEEPSVD